jgi:HEAT repeat protein
MARMPGLPKDTRDDVILWLGFAAGDALGPDGTTTDEDDVRESAIFALSQRPEDEAVPALIRVVEGNLPVHLKKTALFWLGQTDDDRAIDVYEGILRGG